MAIHAPMRETAASSCRRCSVFCDKVVYPAGCVASGCSRLYSYEEHGRTYIGCLEKVFPVEIDLEMFRRAERSKSGFGGIKVAREPLSVCRCEVQRTFEHRSDRPCVNPDFLLSAPRRPYKVTAKRGPASD